MLCQPEIKQGCKFTEEDSGYCVFIGIKIFGRTSGKNFRGDRRIFLYHLYKASSLVSDRRYFFPAEILIVRHHNLPVIKILPFHSKKHISNRAMNLQVKPKGKG